MSMSLDHERLIKPPGSPAEWSEFADGGPYKWIKSWIAVSLEESVAKLDTADDVAALKRLQGGREVLRNLLTSIEGVIQSKVEPKQEGPQHDDLSDPGYPDDTDPASYFGALFGE